jgi:hypothetical protein
MQGFIGGFGGSGSRLISNIFERLGFYTANEFSNKMYDFGENKFVDLFDIGFQHNDYKNLFEFINNNLKQDEFVIKHGHFMFIYDELRTHYPNCKLIYVDRNPIDAAMKLEYIPHVKYGGIVKSDLEKKIQFYIENSKIAIENADLVINYENLCFNSHEEIKKIENFCGLKSVITNYDFIKPSSTIGIGKEYYSKFNINEATRII